MARAKPVHERDAPSQLDFSRSPVAWQFINDPSFVSTILGPIGSGKSYAACFKMFKNAVEQEAYDGVRLSRYALVRNTYSELKTTTLKSWTELFPENVYGPIIWTPPITHHIRLPGHGDEPALDAEFLFLALDQPKDVRKLLSLQLTGAMANEGRELGYAIIRHLASRLRRYPLGRAKDGREMKPTLSQLVIDSNMPDEDHWIHRLAEKEQIRGKYAWTFHKQPPAVLEVPAGTRGAIYGAGKHWLVNPKAENLHIVKPEYYEQTIGGQPLDWIRVYLEAKYGFVQEGSAVWPEYDDNTMAADLAYDKSVPLQIGCDFGLTPAGALGQFMPNGRWHIIEELPTFDMGLERFGQRLLPLLSQMGVQRASEIIVWGDPAGVAREGIWETTAFQYLQSIGLNARPAPSNDFKVRRDAVALPMGRLIAGKPGLLVDRKCTRLRRALSGGYHLERIQVGRGSEIFKDAPKKNEHSHIAEALQYLLLGGGEYRRIVRGAPGRQQAQIHVASTDFDVLA
jgi:hypothetical protein